jgi:4-amino-4-deoxy-L-arabinose transferase-like glycosyltransferase
MFTESDPVRHFYAEGVRSPLVIFAIGLAVRLIAIALIPNEQISDSVWYDGAARSLGSGQGYGFRGERAWFPPGYPFVLWLFYGVFGADQMVGKIANAFFGAATAALATIVGDRLLDRRSGAVAGVIVALWPNFLLHSLILSTEPLSALLWIGSVGLGLALPGHGAIRVAAIATLGLLVGLAILTRPVSVVLIPTLALAVALRSRWKAVAPLVAVTAIAFAMVGAWTLRNATVFGRPVLISTNGGYNLWQVNNEYADGTDFFWANVPAGLAEFETMRTADELTKNDLGYAFALQWMRAHPDRVVGLIPRKVLELWRTDTSAVYEALLSPPMLRSTAVADLIRANGLATRSMAVAYYGAVLMAAVAGTLLLARTHAGAMAILVSPVVTLTLFSLVFQSKDRFHVPADPFLALLAAFALVRLTERVRRVTKSQTGAAVPERPPAHRSRALERSARSLLLRDGPSRRRPLAAS